jgi:hypothetical protein
MKGEDELGRMYRTKDLSFFGKSGKEDLSKGLEVFFDPNKTLADTDKQ